MPSARRRVLVLGLDGGTFDLLDPWMKAGELPFLKSLSARGVRAPLTSVFPPKTIPAWYSFATGQDPGSLGIFGFTEPDGGPGRSRIVQTYRPVEALWDHLSRAGATVGVLNFPVRAGYPINGFVVPGMISESGTTYPEGLRQSLEREVGAPCIHELPPYRDADRAAWLDQATRAVQQHGQYAEILSERYRPDFLFALFRETDRVQHQHWAELTLPFDKVGQDLKQFWRTVDWTVARIDAAFRANGGPAVTLVISDHGHGAAQSDFFTNRWLAQEGYLVFRERVPAQSLRRRLATRLLLASERFGPTRRLVRSAADRLRGGRGREWVTRLMTGEGSFESMAPKIDWQRTLAFSYPVPEGVYLNRYNPSLTPERGREVVRAIRAKLEAYSEARVETFEPAELYRGKNLALAPAILLRINGLASESRMDFSYSEPMLTHRPGYFYGSGVHRMDGILIAWGDGVPNGRLARSPSLLDVAPTILDVMGYPIPPEMTGRSFSGAFAPAP
jgi:predicted AlkP superfamily phosphohydrolase/phosphomutase